ncbi:hypothetical protein F5Y10DRAFT_254979 [Nemania abortiva]|nr:hypothetical protein F5Y10DRAFT_254979 [Nemania abortiva]
MSGFEIAGIVLGAFPIALEGFKGLRSYLQFAQTWWEYEAELDDFIYSLENESMSYSQNLEILLAPLGLSEDQERALMRGDLKSWNDPAFRVELKHRIGDLYYEALAKRLQNIKLALDEAYSLLPIKDGKVTYLESSPVKWEVRRVMFSINRKRDPLLTKIKHINDFIYKHLHRDSLIPRKASTGQRNRFLTLQKQAVALMTTLQRDWDCHCRKPHALGVMTEWEIGTKGKAQATGMFKLMIDEPSQRRLLRVDFTEPLAQEVNAQEPSALELSYEASRQIGLRNHTQSLRKAGKQKNVSIAAISGLSTALAPSHTTTESLWKDKPKRLLKSALKRNSRSVVPATISAQTVQTRVVNFEFDNNDDRPGPAREHRRHQLNICSILTVDFNGRRIESFQIEPSGKIGFQPDPRDQSSVATCVQTRLDSYSTLTTTILRDRMSAGLRMAKTILSLGTSTWVPSGWRTQDICLLKTQDSHQVTGPYILHESLSAAVSQSSRSAKQHTEASLFMLGVLLLELLYGQRLEDQPFRQEYLNNGRPNDYTDLCTAKRWLEGVCQDFDDPIAEAIRLCIDNAFQARADFSEPQFLQAVVEGVLVPLENFVASLFLSRL